MDRTQLDNRSRERDTQTMHLGKRSFASKGQRISIEAILGTHAAKPVSCQCKESGRMERQLNGPTGGHATIRSETKKEGGIVTTIKEITCTHTFQGRKNMHPHNDSQNLEPSLQIFTKGGQKPFFCKSQKTFPNSFLSSLPSLSSLSTLTSSSLKNKCKNK